MLATVAQLGTFLNRDPNTLDPAADMLLAAASDLVTEYCGWHITPSVTEDVTVDGSGLVLLPLPTLRLGAVNSVTENGTALNVGNLAWSEYGVVEKIRGGLWTSRRRGVVANITHGYTTAPNWLVTLVCAMAGRALVTPVGVLQESAGGEQATYTASYLVPSGQIGLLAAERRMLDRIALRVRA